jgi:hypothetical protein
MMRTVGANGGPKASDSGALGRLRPTTRPGPSSPTGLLSSELSIRLDRAYAVSFAVVESASPDDRHAMPVDRPPRLRRARYPARVSSALISSELRIRSEPLHANRVRLPLAPMDPVQEHSGDYREPIAQVSRVSGCAAAPVNKVVTLFPKFAQQP